MKHRISKKIITLCALLSLHPVQQLFSQNGPGLSFPLLCNTYWHDHIRVEDIDYFSGWDILLLDWRVDNVEAIRNNLESIKSRNPDIVYLVYHNSHAVNTELTHPEELYNAAEEYDWWLYNYEGEVLTDPEPWTWNHMLNMTNTEAAKGSHPQGIRPNEYLPA